MRGQPKVFFEELLNLCRKHHVNIELNGKFVFFVDVEDIKNNIVFENVDVTGAWSIREEYSALTASRVVSPTIYEDLEINGTGIKKDES